MERVPWRWRLCPPGHQHTEQGICCLLLDGPTLQQGNASHDSHAVTLCPHASQWQVAFSQDGMHPSLTMEARLQRGPFPFYLLGRRNATWTPTTEGETASPWSPWAAAMLRGSPSQGAHGEEPRWRRGVENAQAAHQRGPAQPSRAKTLVQFLSDLVIAMVKEKQKPKAEVLL